MVQISLFHESRIALSVHASEAFIGKASKGEDVVYFYFDPLVTQHMEASGT